MGTPHKLTLIPYLQRWDATTRVLSLRLLVAPTVNPLTPLVPGPPDVPAFADATLAFAVSLSDAVATLPQRDLVDEVVESPPPGSGTPGHTAPDARVMFAAIQSALAIPDSPTADTFAPQSRDLGRQVHKYLPRSYRTAFPFVRPRTSLAVTDDSYHCLMSCPPNPQPPAPPLVVGWGEALAFAMRQPRLAEALGLVHRLDVAVGPAPRLDAGGWLWVDLATTAANASDYATQAATPGFVRSFATRVPALGGTATRSVFTPVVFPVSDDATAAAGLGSFDKVFLEAVRFDDGFAKIVHARQPVSADPIDEEGTGAPIGRDEGVQLGWDDEDVLEGQNRALGAPPDGEDPVLAPRGVLGYRVDVRPQGGTTWTSLSAVSAPLDLGVDLGTAIEERWAEVHPVEHSSQIWLPPWFVSWRGRSLVVDTQDEQRLLNIPADRPVLEEPVGDDVVDLRYGRRYEFRVRLADTTGGGPGLDAEPAQPGESPVVALHVKRHRPPSIVELDPVVEDPDGSAPSLRVWRPQLGYPDAAMAAGPPARADLLAQIAANEAAPESATAPGIPDPDASYLQVDVLVKLPTYDPAADADGYTTWYRTTRAFPADAHAPLELALSWVDAADYRDVDVSAQLGAEGSVTGPVVLPTARDVRLRVSALGHHDLSYFADQAARVGRSEVVDFHVVAPAGAEADVLADLPPSDALRSVFLRPDPIGDRAAPRPVAVQNRPSPALLERLATATDLQADGTMLLAPEGERLAVAAAGLTHHAAPDAASLELGDPDELAGQWVNVVSAIIDRDWTWRGAGSPSLTVTRTISLPGSGAVGTTTQVGTVEVMDTINVQAARRPQRDHTRLVFLDAFTPPLGPDGRPYEVELGYRLDLTLRGGGTVTRTVSSRLPITTPPAQAPRVVAAGLALTPYRHTADYTATGSRTKRLWVEFAEPLADPRDAYFARAISRTPDPMLLPGVEPVADPEIIEGVPLDPELVRVITPGQVQDLAGLATMQRLEPSADSDRRFLVPLPPNTDPLSPELFGFFTYDIRVGHDSGPAADPLWSTAQGRFGEPLTLEGVQHPAPELPCSVFAEPNGAIRVRAPYAAPYVGLRRVLPDPPNTEIWVVLYGRVMQADASTYRNVQIALRRARTERRQDKYSTTLTREGEVRWDGDDIRAALTEAGLARDTHVTALAVELLPEPNGSFEDPLGGDLGQVRILRTSPLAPVQRSCCTP